jgi:hypothetical protein
MCYLKDLGPSVVMHTATPALRRQNQEDPQFKANLSSIPRFYFKNQGLELYLTV